MRIPLGIKIAITTVVAVIGIVFFILINAYSYLVDDVIEGMKQEIHINMSRLQQTEEFLLQKNEYEQVQVELSSIGSARHMEHIFLADENNKIIAASKLSYVGKNIFQEFKEYSDEKSIARLKEIINEPKYGLWVSDDQSTLFAVYPVILGLKESNKLIENRTGFMVANFDLQWISSNAIETIKLKALPMIIILSVMVILFSVFHDYLLVRRIKDINRAAMQFALSGYKTRTQVKGNDEISDLANAFNEMADKVEIQQSKLIENEENFSVVINSMEDGIITIDDKGIVHSFNRSAEKMFGYLNDEIVGQNVNVLMPEPYQSIHDDILQKYVTTGVKHIIGTGRDLPALHKDGHVFSIHLSVNELPGRANSERLFLGSCLDISLFKEQEEQLRHSQKMDALGKLTGGIAHDYNNMLGVILGYAELLTDKLADDPKLKKYLTEIQHAGQRGAKLTQRLLAFSRQKTSSPDVTNINTLLEKNKNMLEKTLTARIQLIYELDADLWPVYLDKGDLEDALLNMCINSMHAIEHSGQLILTTKNCQLSRHGMNELTLDKEPGDYVCLSVCDTGSGIDEGTLERIFDPFFSTKGDKGSGLGLSQVYGFVNRSKGDIKVESNSDNGSCFKLYFPRYVSAETGKDKILEPVELLGSDAGNETILVVDDELALRSLLKEVLTAKGYTVLLASSGEHAIEIVQNHNIDLVLSDVIMPGMNGYKLVEYISKNYPDIKVQLASGYSDNTHNSEQHELHNNILNKPFERDVLLSRIRELLDG